jgi:hypothetical protein
MAHVASAIQKMLGRCGAEIIDEVVLYYRIGFPSLMHAPIGARTAKGAAGVGCRRNTVENMGRGSRPSHASYTVFDSAGY